jgi:diguanylate cyclase (GGDEF)-like protein/PAS domain S-box-containing protein
MATHESSAPEPPGIYPLSSAETVGVAPGRARVRQALGVLLLAGQVAAIIVCTLTGRAPPAWGLVVLGALPWAGMALLRVNTSAPERARSIGGDAYADLIGHHPGISVVVTDAQFQITWVNETFSALTGFSLEEARGRIPAELLGFEDDPTELQRVREQLAVRRAARFEVRARRKDGQLLWLGCDLRVHVDAQGRTVGGISVQRDVTQEVQARDATRLSERRMRWMIEGANLATWEWDVRQGTIELNPAFYRMLGYTPGEVEFDVETLRELCHPEDRSDADRGVREVLAARADLFSGHHRIRAKDGSYRWIFGAGGVLERAPDGEPLRVFGVQMDVTEHRLADEARRRASEHLQVIAANVPGMIFQWRRSKEGDAAFLYASPGAQTLYGVAPEELMGDPLSMTRFVVGGENPEKRRAAMADSAQNLTSWHVEHQIRARDGELRWLEGDAIPRRDPDGGTTWTGYVADVTRRKVTEMSLRVSEEKLRSLHDLSPFGIALSDSTGRFLQTNQAIEIITGYTQAEILNTNWWDWAVDDGDEHQRRRIEGSLASGRFGPLEKELTRKDGSKVPVQLTGIMVTASDGSRLMWTMVEDIADRKRAEQRISFLAYHDALTGLDNRVRLRERLTQALTQAAANHARVAVMLLDVDRFKAINDSLGHDVGDRVISEFAHRVRAAVRDCDIVARLGGDEFVVVLAPLRRDVPLTELLDGLFEQLRGSIRIDGASVNLTVSAGVSLFPEHGKDPPALLKSADVAMYAAKAQGRDAYRLFTPAMAEATDRSLQLEAELRDALTRNELVLHYQPQVDTRTGRPTGLEALLRWNHPRLGLISPALFIPIAEETRLIVSIGEWVMRTACTDMKAWLDQGGEPLTLAVNVSPVGFAHEDLAERIARSLAQTGLPPQLLEVEITESLAMRDPDVAARNLARLKQLGIRIALDDFGTGHSSLARLKMLDIDRLKIDRSLIGDCTANAYDAALCRASIALGRALGLEVVAEGVETQAQWQLLAQEQCGTVQGFLFAEPMPAPEVFEFLRRSLATPRLRAKTTPVDTELAL